MKPQIAKNTRRNLVLSAIGLISLISAGCALPSKEAWAQIQDRGLIPVLIDANRTEVASNSTVTKPSEQNVVRVHGRTPSIDRLPTAENFTGHPGYVYSPHTIPRKLVDVRGYHGGEEVRCPYTARPFIVPNDNLVASAPASFDTRPRRESPPVNRSVSPVPPVDPGLAHMEPRAESPPVTPAPASIDPVKPPVKHPAANSVADSKAAIPYGTRVAGRPGYVYSPHAAKRQLVNVADIAPGVVVYCPYTNRMFRVPEPLSEEIKPEIFPAQPPTETASAPPVPPEKKETPQAPAPPPPVPSPVNPGGTLGAPPPR